MSYSKKPVYINWEYTSSDKRILELVDILYSDLNLGAQLKNKKKELLKTILANLLRSSRINRGIMYSRNNDWYQNVPSKYKYPFITYDLVTKTIDSLLAKGYIEHLKGSWEMDSKYKYQSSMRPSGKLLEVFGYISPDAIEYRQVKQEVVLRNKFIVEGIDVKTGKKVKEKKRELLDYEETAETIRMRKVVKEWNNLRRNTMITLDLPRWVYDPNDEDDKLIYYADLTEKDNKTYYFKAHPRGAYRTFIYNLEKYGRYSAGIETLIKREYRPYIKINGEPTVELDFQAFHIRMLYNMEGIDYKEDPYQVASDSYPDEKYRARRYFKKIGLMAINAPNEVSTIRSVITDLKFDRKEPVDISYPTVKKMLKHWLQVHQPIAKYLCTGIGLDLMYKDSSIAEKIIQHFTKQNVMVLCVHDSYIIQRAYEEELRRIMIKEYLNIMNTHFDPHIDKKS